MSNVYLEKASSLYEFWDNVSGKKYSELKARKHHLEVALANKETPRSLGHRAEVAGKRMFRARAQAAGGVAGIVGATVAGAKIYENHQVEKTKANLRELMSKQAGLSQVFSSGFKEGAKKGAETAKSTLSQTVKDSGRGILSSINTAHGGKVGGMGDRVFGPKSKLGKEFQSGSHADREKLIKEHAPGKLGELHHLRRKQRVAQVGVYGTGAAIGGAYLKGKSSGRNEVLQNQYY